MSRKCSNANYYGRMLQPDSRLFQKTKKKKKKTRLHTSLLVLVYGIKGGPCNLASKGRALHTLRSTNQSQSA